MDWTYKSLDIMSSNHYHLLTFVDFVSGYLLISHMNRELSGSTNVIYTCRKTYSQCGIIKVLKLGLH